MFDTLTTCGCAQNAGGSNSGQSDLSHVPAQMDSRDEELLPKGEVQYLPLLCVLCLLTLLFVSPFVPSSSARETCNTFI